MPTENDYPPELVEAMARGACRQSSAFPEQWDAAEIATFLDENWPSYAPEIRAALAAASNAGWVMVPREPTEAMVIAGCRHEHLGDMAGRYKAMLAAAPQTPAQPAEPSPSDVWSTGPWIRECAYSSHDPGNALPTAEVHLRRFTPIAALHHRQPTHLELRGPFQWDRFREGQYEVTFRRLPSGGSQDASGAGGASPRTSPTPKAPEPSHAQSLAERVADRVPSVRGKDGVLRTTLGALLTALRMMALEPDGPDCGATGTFLAACRAAGVIGAAEKDGRCWVSVDDLRRVGRARAGGAVAGRDEAFSPHPGCKNPGRCRRGGFCDDAWHCFAGVVRPEGQQ